MKTLRFGCVGCGSMGRLHTLNAKHIPGLDVVAYADVDKTKADSFLQEFGGEYSTSETDKLFNDESLHGVFIITGQKYHPALGIAAANAGKHIFMEKPIAETVDDAIALELAVRKNRVKYLIGFCHRAAPLVKQAKAMIGGSPWISITHSSSSVSTQTNHHLDLLLHLFHEAPVESVYASGGHAYGLDAHLPADSFTGTLRFADGSQASLTMHGGINNLLLGKYSMQLFGRDRCVYLAKKYAEVHLCTYGVAPDISYTFQSPHFGHPDDMKQAVHHKDARGPHGYMGHWDELVALRDAIWNDTDPPITVEEGRHVLQVEKAILESISTNTLIDFKSFSARWDAPIPQRQPAS